MDRNHSLPDYASEFRFERDRLARIAELLDIQRRIATHGEPVEVIRRFRNIDRTMPEHVQGPPSPDGRQDPRTICANWKVISKPVSL